MARAYASFADGGKRIDGSIFGNAPRAVKEIKTGSKVDVNRPVYRPILSSTQADVVNQLLQGVVQSGTGTAAALPGRAVAGKTGTTENYGDAWFVGYTPQFVAAVWVGYPDKLVPMLTEFHGHAVAGGTFPALIWKAFMQKALALKQVPPASFEAPASMYAAPVKVVNRGGLLERDNGVCKNAYTLEFYGGQGPARTATCKPNEVEIPDVVGQTIQAARARLDGQPLTATVIYKPARTGERIGYVVGQFPRRGTASAYDKITLVLAKSLHGVIPRVVGLKLPHAERKLARLHLKVRTKGPVGGRVVRQSLPPRTASAPGRTIVLTLKQGTGG
jgi:membrane peptidoglycan carboxypeptidase